MNRRKRATVLASGIGAMAVVLAAWGGVAVANSSPYQPGQNNCPWNANAWNTPANETYPGCHNAAINVESGGTTNGNPNNDNTRYVEVGSDSAGNDPNSQRYLPFIFNPGQPGTTGGPHAGCISANTDGTGYTPDPQNSGPNDIPQPSGPGTENSPYGCGNNPGGLGFEANYDFYQFYCPVVAAAGHPCEDPSPPGYTTVTPDLGTGANVEPIVQNGVLVYASLDDNWVDNGEHDGFDACNQANPATSATVSQARCAGTGNGCPTSSSDPNCNPNGQSNTNTDGAVNGPSDGGAMVLSFTPQWAQHPTTPTPSHPEGLVNYSFGMCADGICDGITTQQNTIYYGCNPAGNTSTQHGTDGATNPQNNAADDQCAPGTAPSTDSFQNNTPSSTAEASNCSAGGPYSSTEQPCLTNSNGSPNSGGANAYRQQTPPQVNNEPGVQTYQDPDPQRSPAVPFGTPGLYAGTCGAYANDGNPGVVSTVTGGAVADPNPGWIVEAPDPSC
ncbi:MAG TPA: hypothetical protein VMV14_10485 [Acidimicrobiales bacterium]|nr:hypothetical protein [Acidimicrobiales bacterium]